MGEIELYMSKSPNPDENFSISLESLLMLLDNPYKQFSLLKEPILKTNITSILLKKITESGLESEIEDAFIFYMRSDDYFYIRLTYIPSVKNKIGYVVSGDYKTQLFREARRKLSVMAEQIKEKDEIIERKNREIGELNLLPGAPEYYQVKQHFENLQNN